MEEDSENTADAAWRRKLKWCSRDEPGNGGLFYGRGLTPDQQKSYRAWVGLEGFTYSHLMRILKEI